MIADNYALAGTNAIMYNVDIANYFTNDGQNYPSNNVDLTDIGFEWKESTATEWNVKSIKKDTSATINNASDLIGYGDTLEGNYKVTRYFPTKYFIYPLKVVIMGLSPVSYNLRCYALIGGTKEYYNQQTISPVGNSSNITFSDYETEMVDGERKYVIHTDMSQEVAYYDESQFATIKSLIDEAKTACSEIYNMFFSGLQKEYKITVYSVMAGWAASTEGGNNININIKSKALLDKKPELLRTQMIHELAHINMSMTFNNTAKIKKFMEFATSAENAMWKWLSSHNYPVISSASYDYVGDCLVVAACNLTKN